jgi:hypothetical protein
MRALRLQKETLAELTTDDLGLVVGGVISGASCENVCPASDLRQCLTGSICLTFDGCFTGTTTNTTQ